MFVPGGLLAALATAPDDPVDGPRLRAYFANMLMAVDARHASEEGCRGRIEDALKEVARLAALGSPATWGAFYSALMDAIEILNDRHFYELRDPVNQDLDRQAVTFQSADDQALRAWMDGPVTAARLVKAVRTGLTKPGAAVGLPRRAVWLTPLKGRVAEVIETARGGPDPDLAWEVRDMFANSGWLPDRVIVAFITRGSMRDLRFSVIRRAGGTAMIGPVGSTVLEARTHKHFRHWPHPHGSADRYGRTYHLDRDVRLSAKPPLSYGVPEAVRSPIPLTHFGDCVVIGKLTSEACRVREPDLDFLQAVGATKPLVALLQDLVAKL